MRVKQMKEIGSGGEDRKLNLLSQVLSGQRRSTAALPFRSRELWNAHCVL